MSDHELWHKTMGIPISNCGQCRKIILPEHMTKQYEDFEPWPDLGQNRMMEFLLVKYPDKPGIAQLFQSAVTQKLTNNKIAWEDLGIFDVAKQQELELEVMNLINQFCK